MLHLYNPLRFSSLHEDKRFRHLDVSSSLMNFVLIIFRSWFAKTFLHLALITRLRCAGPEIRKWKLFFFMWG